MRVKYYYVDCFIAFQMRMLGIMADCTVTRQAVIECNAHWTLTHQFAPYSNFVQIGHCNAQSLRGHINEFHEIFLGQNLNVICISESWLKSKIALSLSFPMIV